MTTTRQKLDYHEWAGIAPREPSTRAITRAEYDAKRKHGSAGPTSELAFNHPEPYHWLEYDPEFGTCIVLGSVIEADA